MSRHHRKPNQEVPPGAPLDGNERRNECRYAVVHDEGWLGWWEGQTFLNAPVRILDISLRGARLAVTSAPAADLPVWFCPPNVAPPEWLEVKLVQTKKRMFGPREVRIAFRKIFPYETFKALVYGRGATRGYEMKPHILPTTDDDCAW